MQDAQPDDPAAQDGVTQIMPFSEFVFVTTLVVALLIAAFMLYPG